jgi:hypothetical protein
MRLRSSFQALLEEADIKIAETSKDQYEFKRDVNNSVRTIMIHAQTVLNFDS